jgi:hypothetical protein
MGLLRDTSDPAGLSHTRFRRYLSLPSGTAGTNLGKTARYAGENRDPLQYLPVREAIEELVLIWNAWSAEEWQDRILKIPL